VVNQRNPFSRSPANFDSRTRAEAIAKGPLLTAFTSSVHEMVCPMACLHQRQASRPSYNLCRLTFDNRTFTSVTTAHFMGGAVPAAC